MIRDPNADPTSHHDGSDDISVEAMRKGVAKAKRLYKFYGEKMVIMRDGKIQHVDPDEVWPEANDSSQ